MHLHSYCDLLVRATSHEQPPNATLLATTTTTTLRIRIEVSFPLHVQFWLKKVLLLFKAARFLCNNAESCGLFKMLSWL